MSWPYAHTPFIWPVLVSAGFMTALACYGWKHRAVPGAALFTVINVCSAVDGDQ